MSIKALQLHISTEHIEKKLFWGLLVGIVCNLVLYVYFVNASVLDIVERTSLRGEIQTTGTAIGSLETEYFHLTKDVTITLASSLGFMEAKDVQFASKGSFAVGGTQANNEI